MMLGKGVTAGDCLLAIAVVLPIALLAGAGIGYLGDRFEISGGLRLLAIVALTALSGHIARTVVMRRIRARSAPQS